MLSKMITRRQKSASEVEAAISHHAPEAASSTGRLLGPYLGEGEELPDLELFQRLLGRGLGDHRGRIVATDEDRLAKVRLTRGLRDRRDAAASRLGDELLLLRDTVEGIFGAQAAEELLGIGAPFDRDPVALSRLGRRAVETLRADGLELPLPRAPAVTVDFGRWADDLEPALEELEVVLGQLRWERRGAEAALVAKHQAMEDYDRFFLGVARLQEALFHFAGLTGLAERVRPSVRRPGLTHQEAVTEAEAPSLEEPAFEDASSF
jgi:hypothetical protein